MIKEPKNIDYSTKSEPWTEQEVADFRKIMQEINATKPNTKKAVRAIVAKINSSTSKK